MNPAFENLTKGRHVYFTNAANNEEAAIVARVHVEENGEPTGGVNLMVIDVNGFPRSVVNVFYDEDGHPNSWRWMHAGQPKVSTAGAAPTMLAPPVAAEDATPVGDPPGA